jgi:hypothetical protein
VSLIINFRVERRMGHFNYSSGTEGTKGVNRCSKGRSRNMVSQFWIYKLGMTRASGFCGMHVNYMVPVGETSHRGEG